MQGWIKLHRSFLDWEWFGDEKTVKLFLYLLLKANHKDTKWRGQLVQRGQLFTGRNLIAKDTGLSVQSIRTSLKRLKSTNNITIKSTSKNSIITVINYDSYQGDSEQINQQINQQPNNQSTSNQPASNHIQECNKVKNEKKKGFSPKKFIVAYDWINPEIWSEWIDFKKGKKAAVTERALKANIKKLESLGKDSANAIIAKSLDAGWTDFYQLKEIEQPVKELKYLG